MVSIQNNLEKIKYDQFKLEEEIKKFWDENKIYHKVKEKSMRSKKKFYFLDGPPYASAKSIHVGTAWNKVIKDTVLRYYRMRGYNVWDIPGYDTHGLPIEVKIEKEYGIKSKKEIIEKIGVENFVESCKRFVDENIKAMTEQFKEIGVFMDWENPYVTYRDEYIESGWWLIKQAWRKGLLYKGERVVHWCPRCETTLADYEVSEYKELRDPSIYVKFKVKNSQNEYLLIWTTTPWTLPANAFVMAHPDLDYVKVKVDGEILILAKARLEKVMSEAGKTEYEVLEEFKGTRLEGLEYIHPLEDLVPAQAKLAPYHKVVLAPDAVTATEGTGLVHSAPGHGEIDYEINEKIVGAPLISLVDNTGKMTEDSGRYHGLYFRTDANKAVIEDLEKKGALFHKGSIIHRYPVCWRCKTPLVLRATEQWFIAVRRLKERLIEEARSIEWRPNWATTRFINLLKEVRDWVISRQRFWGIPLPVWECSSCGYRHVIGSVDELVELGGHKPEQLHRPWIDRVTLKCPKCGGVMKRVPDVLDVWFDSGIAFYASLSYPRNKELYESLKPVDFIVEGHDQIRGWFFSLLRSGIIGFDEKPYKRVLVHGFALDEKGREMHKSLGNYIEFKELISRVPRDVIRLWAMNNTIWEDLRFSWKSMDMVWRSFNIIWNVFTFASTYMSIDNFDPEQTKLEDVEDALQFEDKWLLSRFNRLLKEYHEAMKDLRLHEAARIVKDFPVEDISHWYIRLIRRRVWEEEATKSKLAAYAVLYHVLKGWLLMAAPFIPYTTEYLYQKLIRPAEPSLPETIHLLEIPEPDNKWIDDGVEQLMDIARKLTEASAAARMKAGIKLRRPVKRLIIALKDNSLRNTIERAAQIIKDLANVKEIEIVGVDFFENMKVYGVEPNYKTMGPEFKKMLRKVIAYVEENKEKVAKDIVEHGEHKAEIEGVTVKILPKHVELKVDYPSWLSTVETDIGIIGIDTRLTKDEILEGHAREIVRRIQAMRKDLSLPVDAYIEVWLEADPEFIEAVEKHRNYIMTETRARNLRLDKPPEEVYQKEWEVDGKRLLIGIKKI
ncbi:MAG: isoleucine--tRNA ligase [Desulfurococcales archaeon]|nr:isoleucine--tRNA ligase [Desulfurococcales archaeon]